jgi:hypothetical protein
MPRFHTAFLSRAGFTGIVSCIISFYIAGCSTYPLDTSGRDLPEFESVWQYLSAYSLWQDKVPQEQAALESFTTPEALLSSVADTFHGINYTTYDSAHLPAGGALSAAMAGAADTTVYWLPLTNSTALLKITEFKQDTTYPAFLGVLPFLVQYSNIIVDLRDNGGGDIKTVDSIMEYFLPVNTPYIQAMYRNYNESTRSAQTVPWETWKTLHEHALSLAGKHLAVLVNGGSASASEILAAGLKDGRAGGDTVVLVGETTYGKGMGQVIVSRTYLGKRDLKITFLRLKGISSRIGDYHRKGIAPDIQVAGLLPPLSMALHILEPSAPLLKTAAVPASGSAVAEAYVRIPANPQFEK